MGSIKDSGLEGVTGLWVNALRSISSPLWCDLPWEIVSTHQEKCASQGRMGTGQEGGRRASAITGVVGYGLRGGG